MGVSGVRMQKQRASLPAKALGRVNLAVVSGFSSFLAKLPAIDGFLMRLREKLDQDRGYSYQFAAWTPTEPALMQVVPIEVCVDQIRSFVDEYVNFTPGGQR